MELLPTGENLADLGLNWFLLDLPENPLLTTPPRSWGTNLLLIQRREDNASQWKALAKSAAGVSSEDHAATERG